MKRVDIVVAVRNEEESLPGFFVKARALHLPAGFELGYIFIEDGSTDRTREILREKAIEDSRIKYIFLKEGRGQAPAIALGLAHSNADAAIMMDVDGGHPLELIPSMVSGFAEGALAVQALRRKISKRRRYRDLGTLLFNRVYRLLTGVDTEKQNVYYRLVSQELFKELLKNNRWKHFLRINYQGYRGTDIQYVEFDATERVLGLSKYNFRRLLRFALIAVLSSISLARFMLATFAALLMVGALVVLGAPVLWVPLVIGLIIAMIAFAKMSSKDVLTSFTIVESKGLFDEEHRGVASH